MPPTRDGHGSPYDSSESRRLARSFSTAHSQHFDLHRRSVLDFKDLLSSVGGNAERAAAAERALCGGSFVGGVAAPIAGLSLGGGEGVDLLSSSPGRAGGSFLLSHAAARPCGSDSAHQRGNDGMHGVQVGEMGAISSFQESRGMYWLEWTKRPMACLVVAKLGSESAESAALEIVRFLAKELAIKVYVEPSFEAQVAKSGALPAEQRAMAPAGESLDSNGNGSDVGGSSGESGGGGSNGTSSPACDDILPATAWRGTWTSEDGADDNNLAALVDFAVTVGGDGTVLWTSSLFNGPCPPLLAFNMGTLGFMTPNTPNEHEETLRAFTSRAVQLNLRRRLACRVVRATRDARGRVVGTAEESTCTVLNEIVVDRGPSPYLTNVEVFCDGAYITQVQGDGLIIATPTGSTAYSLAAGGSMVHPQVPGILFTPICPHSLSFRPLVFPDSVMLRVQVPLTAKNPAFVAFDGKGRQELRPGDAVELCISRWALPEVCMEPPTVEWVSAITNGLHWNRATSSRKSGTGRLGSAANARRA